MRSCVAFLHTHWIAMNGMSRNDAAISSSGAILSLLFTRIDLMNIGTFCTYALAPLFSNFNSTTIIPLFSLHWLCWLLRQQSLTVSLWIIHRCKMKSTYVYKELIRERKRERESGRARTGDRETNRETDRKRDWQKKRPMKLGNQFSKWVCNWIQSKSQSQQHALTNTLISICFSNILQPTLNKSTGVIVGSKFRFFLQLSQERFHFSSCSFATHSCRIAFALNIWLIIRDARSFLPSFCFRFHWSAYFKFKMPLNCFVVPSAR